MRRYLPIYWYIYQSTGLSTFLLAYLPIYQSNYPLIYLPIYFYIYLLTPLSTNILLYLPIYFYFYFYLFYLYLCVYLLDASLNF